MNGKMRHVFLILVATIYLLSCAPAEAPLNEDTPEAKTVQTTQIDYLQTINAHAKSDDGDNATAHLEILTITKDKLLIGQKHEYFSVGSFSASSSPEVSVASALKVTLNGESVPIPASAVFGLAFPNEMAVSIDADLIDILISGGTGASSWTCNMQFKNGVLIQKTLVDGAFGDELMEQTFYSTPIFD